MKLATGGEDDTPASVKALAAARAAFNGHVAITSAELVTPLNGEDDLPFGGWHGGRGLNSHDLARLLKRYDIRPRTVRLADGATPQGIPA